MSKSTLRLLSLFMVLAIIINMCPISVFATELQGNAEETDEPVTTENQSEDVYILEEVIENRTEYSKDFKLSNGLHMAAVYSNAVHFQKDGQWEEIDNTLKLAETRSGNSYMNTAGNWQASFPEKLSDSKHISISKNGYTLSFCIVGELRNPGNEIGNTGEISTIITESDSLALDASE